MAEPAPSADLMKISVVTVCFNSEATIAHTIRSFLSQTYPHKEMLVIDGASSDRTLEVVREFSNPDIRIVSGKDGGIYDAMNKGLQLYTGDAVGFLNSDDTFHDEDALARIATGLETAEAVHSGVIVVKSHETKQIVRTWRGESFKRGQFRWGWMPPHPTFYVRRSLAEKIGEFDLSYSIAADYDYMLRALELHAESTAYVPGPLIDFLIGGRGSGFGQVLGANFACLKSRRRHLGAPFLDLAFFLKPSFKMLTQNPVWERARHLFARGDSSPGFGFSENIGNACEREPNRK
jgi:glycosyltransferase